MHFPNQDYQEILLKLDKNLNYLKYNNKMVLANSCFENKLNSLKRKFDSMYSTHFATKNVQMKNEKMSFVNK